MKCSDKDVETILEMREMLLSLEWTERHDDDIHRYCPRCGARKGSGGHDVDPSDYKSPCRLATLLERLR